jgi:BirA family transcriptional regulator, biotin operon repressor / biotin---[acetyl-CoA-carboxylase] ligase
MEIVLKGLKTTVVGRNILFYRTLPSTMDFAKKLAHEGIPEGVVVLCDEQTEGRGRQGRKWLATPSSSILMSVVFRPTLKELPQLNMLASLAIVLTIDKAAGVKSTVKWPNDVLVDGRKVAGILMENVFEGDVLQAAILGVGFNISLDVSAYPEIATIATSLSAEARKDFGRDEVMRILLEEMDSLYQGVKRNQDVYRQWLPYVETLGKTVSIKSGQSVEEGLAQSINTDGSITLRRSDGTVVTIATGE